MGNAASFVAVNILGSKCNCVSNFGFLAGIGAIMMVSCTHYDSPPIVNYIRRPVI